MRIDKSEFTDLKTYILGATAGIVTNMSLIVGLGSAHAPKAAVIGGLLTFALADNISDSLGIHLYKETGQTEQKITWVATLLNFSGRLVVSFSFIALVLALSMPYAMPVAIGWGLLLLTILSYLIARSRNEKSPLEVLRHLSVAIVVIALSWLVGYLIGERFH
jgi:VIT1/CCC1 family predicted Fe2+/Mn2+ transporter